MAYYDDAKEEWDMRQEIARSAFADMLHDKVIRVLAFNLYTWRML
jgi:hypothetical protein